ncbi:hypothetical protein D2E24_1891, partial [Bifidobacterium samirii]
AVSGRPRSRRRHPPDHQRQGEKVIPEPATRSRPSGPTKHGNGWGFLTRLLLFVALCGSWSHESAHHTRTAGRTCADGWSACDRHPQRTGAGVGQAESVPAIDSGLCEWLELDVRRDQLSLCRYCYRVGQYEKSPHCFTAGTIFNGSNCWFNARTIILRIPVLDLGRYCDDGIAISREFRRRSSPNRELLHSAQSWRRPRRHDHPHPAKAGLKPLPQGGGR